MADEVHPVPVVVLPADVPEAPPAAVPAPVGEENPADAAIAAPQEVNLFICSLICFGKVYTCTIFLIVFFFMSLFQSVGADLEVS